MNKNAEYMVSLYKKFLEKRLGWRYNGIIMACEEATKDGRRSKEVWVEEDEAQFLKEKLRENGFKIMRTDSVTDKYLIMIEVGW